MQIARDGKPLCVIVVGSDATAGEKTASRILQEYLQKATGAAFAIRSEKEVGADEPQILVAASDSTGLGTEGIVIKAAGKKLLLAGGRPRGVIYAVESFLEDQVGVRWWTSDEEFVP